MAGADTLGSQMGCPHLLGLGFLLLAAAAPCPNIAMASDHPAERTHVSSSGNTKVTVYCCKDCEISLCESGSFKRFVKIAETEKEVFSNGIIELVTTETHVLMCFQQANTFPEGIYGIVWLKTVGAGLSCGILKSAAFSEHGRGSNSTEENKICCEAETNVWESNPTLKCHTEMSEAETRIPTPDNPGRGSNTAISLTLLLFLLLCAGIVTVYYYRRHQNSQALRINRQASEEQNLTHV